MRLSKTTLLIMPSLAACFPQDDRDIHLSDLGGEDLTVTVATVSFYRPFPGVGVTVDFPLPGSDPNAGADSDCVRLAPEVDVRVNGVPAQIYRGGRTMNTWSGCEPSGMATATVDVETVEVSFSDGSSRRTIQIPFALPALESPADGRVAAGSTALVRLPGLSQFASASFSARLYALGDGPQYDLEPSRPNGAPRPIDLGVTRDGDLLRIPMPTSGLGTWTMYISHPDQLASYELPATRCDFHECRAALSDFYAVYPGIQVELVE